MLSGDGVLVQVLYIFVFPLVPLPELFAASPAAVAVALWFQELSTTTPGAAVVVVSS